MKAVTPEAAAKPATPDVDVQITLVCGGITNVEAPIVVGARYEGVAFAGPTKVFDRLLDSWLTRAVDLGIIGSALGQLFPISLEQYHKAGIMNAPNLLLAGMGEPGRFARDSLQFVISNIVVAVKVMGHSQFATNLIGTRRNELSIGEAIRGLVQGIDDGYERIQAIADDDSKNREFFRKGAEQPLCIILVDPNEEKLKQIKQELDGLAIENSDSKVKLEISQGRDVAPDPKVEPSPIDVEPDLPVTYLRITGRKFAARAMQRKPVLPVKRKKPAVRAVINPFPTDVFEFSALSDLAVVPQREHEVNTHLMRDLPDRMTKECTSEERADLGVFFTNYLIPEDFRKLTEGPANLTLEVDETTAVYPWEMAGHKKYAGTSFLSTNVAVSRQFRSLLSPPPTSPPALNNKLNALIIADPARDELALPHARDEGSSVVEVLEQARIAWADRYEIKATVRIGAREDEDVKSLLKKLCAQNKCVVSAEPCDPLELAMLLVNEQYDVVHYAGHGLSDPKTGLTGWVFAADCILSAKEIFRVRQVPRLVFANACFSAVTTDHSEQRTHMVGLAQAFFGRGIPNFIGTGWQVDDACAAECAKWFYARVMGLRRPSAIADVIGLAPPATIGEALREARKIAYSLKPQSSSWGAYQHYGCVNDKLVAIANAPTAAEAPTKSAANAAPQVVIQIRDTQPVPASVGDAQIATNGPSTVAKSAPADPNLVYVNGIDFETGTYAFPPRSIDEIAKQVLVRPGVDSFDKFRGDVPRSFGLPFGVTDKLEDGGWGIVFHDDTSPEVRKALEPLIEFRRTRATNRLKVLDYKKGEQARGWYERHGISPGNVDPEIIPYYLLLIGTPDQIPFEFQYLIGVEYAVGRLAFDKADDYERYARSTVTYESAKTVPNAKEIAYWGTRHLGDPATNLSASLLIDPLANGVPGAAGALKRAINTEIGYDRKMSLGDDATKANLLQSLHAQKPPAMLFTASHGMQMRSGQAAQATAQGALLCQDWPGFGSVRAEHFIAAADITDDANVNGLVALLFACFGAGTPDADQFLMDLSQAGKTPPLAPQPFIAALPRRLLAHPNGSALAVIGHVDRAWGFSIQAPKVADAQISTFRNSIGNILNGTPVGHAMCEQFGARFSLLSALLLSATSPSAPAAMRLSDRDLVTRWLERNDAQNYVLLGDPAVRIRKDVLT
jgi:CHAT domain-containing protein